MMNCKKLVFTALSVLLVLALLGGCGQSSASPSGQPASGGGESAAAPSADPIKWKFATIYVNPSVTTAFNSHAMSQQYFCDIIGERTGGRLEVDPFYDGILGTTPELFEMLQSGEIDVYLGQPMSSIDSRFGAWSIPYLFNDVEEIKALACDQDGEIFKMSKEWLSDYDMELLAVGTSQFRGFINSKREIRSIEDLKGLTVRTYQDPIVTAFWSSICSATAMGFGDVYTSLQTGAIDGLEFAGSSCLSNKLYEVTKYYTDINWQWVSGANFLVSSQSFNALPDDLKEIVRECAIEAMEHQGELEAEDTRLAEDELEKMGVQVYNLTEDERASFVTYARTLDSEFRDFIGEETFDAVLSAVEGYRNK
ncbi:TRAP transporter substrate-binding protein [Bacteroides sp. OttesenSCG-928-J23]|nr:TRAP transporter substrate-binding protein [Bacteroides sp. OttesenSCG-928-J23]